MLWRMAYRLVYFHACINLQSDLAVAVDSGNRSGVFCEKCCRVYTNLTLHENHGYPLAL